MSIFKRGNVYWYHFLHDGRHVQRSTKQGNPRIARQIEAAYKLALSRVPDEREKAVALDYLRTHNLSGFAHVLLNLNEFLYVR